MVHVHLLGAGRPCSSSRASARKIASTVVRAVGERVRRRTLASRDRRAGVDAAGDVEYPYPYCPPCNVGYPRGLGASPRLDAEMLTETCARRRDRDRPPFCAGANATRTPPSAAGDGGAAPAARRGRAGVLIVTVAKRLPRAGRTVCRSLPFTADPSRGESPDREDELVAATRWLRILTPHPDHGDARVLFDLRAALGGDRRGHDKRASCRGCPIGASALSAVPTGRFSSKLDTGTSGIDCEGRCGDARF